MKTTFLVIGAGPAGTVAASYLIKQGADVLVVEKQTFPRFVIGESLLPKCMECLEEAELLDAVKDQGYQPKTGASFYKNGIRCDFNFKEQFTKSWSWTWQTKRADFDHKLAEGAQKNGVEILFNTAVIDVALHADSQTTTCKTANGETLTIHSKFILDASGYGRVLPRLFNLSQATKSPSRGAVFAHFKDKVRGAEPFENNIIIHAFNQNKSWYWCIPFSDNTTSVGIVSDVADIENFAANKAAIFKEMARKYPGFEGRFLPENLLFEPKHILGYSVGVKKMYGNGYALCGNSTEFLDPIFSSGATLAMISGLEAAKLAWQQQQGKNINWQTQYEDKMRHGVSVFRSYVDGWYNGTLQTIFFNPHINQTMKEQICSVLAGHVWDFSNPFVQKHKTIIKTLAKVIEINNRQQNK